jgi:polyhydroxybutyrate depolymerase
VRRVFPVVIALLIVAACSTGDADDSGADPSASTLTSGCNGDSPVATGTEILDVAYGDVARSVERIIPPGYDGATPSPLLVSLHGFSSTIEQQDLFSGLPEAAASRGYILLTPQAEPATVPIGDEEMSAPLWNLQPEESDGIPGAQDDIGFLEELIDSTVAELCVDENRVYVTGNSNGAGMSATLACEMTGRLAAIAPVSGINLAGTCDQLGPVSVIAFHGDADPLVPYGGGSAADVDVGTPSVEGRVGEFAAAADCGPDPQISSPFDDIALRQWRGCQPGLDVELYTVLRGGHTWPGMLNYVDAERLARLADTIELVDVADLDLAEIAGHMTVNIEATALMLDFFDDHRRR